MEVAFFRTGRRRYAIEIRREGGEVLRMDPAPGFDEYLPHDMQHLIVEEQLGLSNGIFGRLAKGGTSSTFASVGNRGALTKRKAARRRRTLQQKERRLAAAEASQFGESERATYVAWCDWLRHCPEPALRRRGESMAETAEDNLVRMSAVERERLEGALPNIRARIDEIARRWHVLEVEERMVVVWDQHDT